MQHFMVLICTVGKECTKVHLREHRLSDKIEVQFLLFVSNSEPLYNLYKKE